MTENEQALMVLQEGQLRAEETVLKEISMTHTIGDKRLRVPIGEVRYYPGFNDDREWPYYAMDIGKEVRKFRNEQAAIDWVHSQRFREDTK